MPPKLKDVIPISGRLHHCALMVPARGKKILNVGCSFGWYEDHALKNGAREVVGLDLNQPTLTQAQKDVPEAKFLKGSATKLPFSPKKFDLVTLFDVLEHLSRVEQEKALSEAGRVLKKQGRLVISVPNRHWLAIIFDPAWYLGHRHYSAKQMSQILEKAGFQVGRVETSGGVLSILSAPILYLWQRLAKGRYFYWRWLEKKKDEEFKKTKGLMCLFLVAKKKEG